MTITLSAYGIRRNSMNQRWGLPLCRHAFALALLLLSPSSSPLLYSPLLGGIYLDFTIRSQLANNSQKREPGGLSTCKAMDRLSILGWRWCSTVWRLEPLDGRQQAEAGPSGLIDSGDRYLRLGLLWVLCFGCLGAEGGQKKELQTRRGRSKAEMD